MSAEQSSEKGIQLFFAPYGITQYDKNQRDVLSPLSQQFDRVRSGGGEQVTPLVDNLYNHAKDLNTLYKSISKPEMWRKITPCDNIAYQVETDSALFTVSIRPVPDDYANQISSCTASCYVYMELYSKSVQITSIYGIGFHTENSRFNDDLLGEYIVSYVQNWMMELASQKPDFLEKLAEKEVEKRLKKMEDKVIKAVEKKLGQYIPGNVMKLISFAMDPTFDNFVNIAETTIISLMPTVLGKILAYVAFEVLNYLFTNDYNIRYAIVNRTNNSFSMSNYYDYFSSKLPYVLKTKSNDNVIHRPHLAPIFNDINDKESQPMWVIQAPCFTISNESDCPSALIRFKHFSQDTQQDTQYILENIVSAYDIIYTQDNEQGVKIFGEHLKSGEHIYYELLNGEPAKRLRCSAENDYVLITQVTNALSGVGNDTYDVVLMIDEKSGEHLD